MSYLVTLYNQHAGTAVSAVGKTKPIAFRKALGRAGEPWLREGGDKLTTLRTLFHDHFVRKAFLGATHVSHPNGAGVEVRRINPDRPC